MKKLMNKPITWGGLLKLTGWATLIGIIIDVVVYMYMGILPGPKEWINKVKDRLSKKEGKEEEES